VHWDRQVGSWFGMVKFRMIWSTGPCDAVASVVDDSRVEAVALVVVRVGTGQGIDTTFPLPSLRMAVGSLQVR
jgi:hypothetical protein